MADETENNGMVRQPHGGALRAGGKPGNSGGKPGRSGRLKEKTRRRMLRLAGRTLAALERDVAALEATGGMVGTLANQTPHGPQHGPMTRPDAIKLLLALAKHGVGVEDSRKIEQTTTTRYIIKLPQRVTSPLRLLAGDLQSDAATSEKP